MMRFGSGASEVHKDQKLPRKLCSAKQEPPGAPGGLPATTYIHLGFCDGNLYQF